MTHSTTENVLWDLFVLEYARSRNQPIASLVQGAFTEGAINVPFAFVVARSADRIVLIDTGFMKEESGALMAQKFGIPEWISPLRLLHELEIKPDQVGDIVLSHAHFDHMGSIDQYPKANLHLQKKELLSWIEAMALPPRFGYLTSILDTADIRSALDAADEHRLHLLEGDRDNVLPGIHVREGHGHTLGQQYIVVETARGRYVVAGDCIYSSRNLLGINKDGIYAPLGTGIGSVWDQLKTFDRINQEIDGDLNRLLMLHDFDRWSRFQLYKEIESFGIFKAT
jgi:glyoxylase-like metal-dependent hydrolase (beta-lactamase superfamily II)